MTPTRSDCSSKCIYGDWCARRVKDWGHTNARTPVKYIEHFGFLSVAFILSIDARRDSISNPRLHACYSRMLASYQQILFHLRLILRFICRRELIPKKYRRTCDAIYVLNSNLQTFACAGFYRWHESMGNFKVVYCCHKHAAKRKSLFKHGFLAINL